MSLLSLPLDIKILLLEECPQLRFILSDLRQMLCNFIKPQELEYPTNKNKHRGTTLINYNELKLKFKNENWKCVATLESHNGNITTIAFHPSKPILATGSIDCKTKLWRIDPDTTITTCVATLERHIDTILAIAFHSSLPLLATGSNDQTVKIWNMNANLTEIICVG